MSSVFGSATGSAAREEFQEILERGPGSLYSASAVDREQAASLTFSEVRQGDRSQETKHGGFRLALMRCLVGIGIAAASTSVATALRLALAPVVGTEVPYVTYFGAAVALAWFRGFRTAALSICLSAFAGAHYFLGAEAGRTLLPGHGGRAAVIGFSLVSLTISWLIDFQRKTLARGYAAEREQAAVARENARLYERAKQAQRDLELSNRELQRANHDLEVFAYSTSHDLLEPLRIISLSAGLLERRAGSSLPEEGVKILRQISAASRRMTVLMADLREYRSVCILEPSAPPNIDANRVLAHVLDDMREVISETGTIVTSSKLPVVAIHEHSLEQILKNLIGNAIKYRGGEAPRVRIEARSRDGRWLFSVTDNGIGIDMQYADKIFELFKRLHSQEHYPGSGFGLAICKRLVEQFGGRIYLERSALGKGSTFCFTAPPPEELGAARQSSAIATAGLAVAETVGARPIPS